MPEGIIETLASDRGFGFIRSPDGERHFFHRSEVVSGFHFYSMKEGDSVEFELQISKLKPGQQEAHQVRLQGVSASAGHKASDSPRAGSASRGHAAPHSRPGGNTLQVAESLLPYGFVSIDPAKAVTDAPVWHDGKEGGELLSGELRCTLEALTPLLPGNARYKCTKEQANKWGFDRLDPDKQIAEPLRLADGRVVIAGSALKGMIRHSLGALLSAPMERVAERHYTYRPNLDLNRQGVPEKYTVRPALVVAKDDEGCVVEVFSDARDAIFVRNDTLEELRRNARDNVIRGVVLGCTIERNKFSDRLSRKKGQQTRLNHRLVEYRGGIDGEGIFGAAFIPPTKTYQYALVPVSGVVGQFLIGSELYQRYLHDQKSVIACDTEGHLTAHPLSDLDTKKAQKAIFRNAELKINQLIYVELTTENGKVTQNSRIVSFGHHFRYRWAYSSSVRKQQGKVRGCLNPLDCERQDAAPARLSGARLLFGYVRDDKTNPIGQGVFERLAGRIAINHAVSDGVPEFLGEKSKGYSVSLKILGQPKSSAWEFYLRQGQTANRPPATYGDLPGDAGGELAGRKFYRHQPRSQKVSDIATTEDKITRSKEDKIMRLKQATLARFICRTGTRFLFAIRFQGLRAWELGALLAVLQPGRLAAPGGDSKVYAHKLGLGRPLGMGSVRIDIDGLTLSQGKGAAEAPATDGFRQEAIKALRERLAGVDPREWLAMLRFEDRGPVDYPRKGDIIFNWHTDLRKDYGKLRRQARPDWESLNQRIRSVLPRS